MSIETIPVEIKRMILAKLPHTSLQSLTHASPTFCRVYKQERERFLTLATIRHLVEQGINMEGPESWPVDIPNGLLTTDADANTRDAGWL